MSGSWSTTHYLWTFNCVRAPQLFHLIPQVRDQSERESEMCVSLYYSGDNSLTHHALCRKRLGGKHNRSYVLAVSHSLAAGGSCCVKFLPAGADTAAASARTTVDDARRAEIMTRLAARPDPSMVAVCRICKGLTRKTTLQVQMHLRHMQVREGPEGPVELVWHLRYWCVCRTCLRGGKWKLRADECARTCSHGKEFEKRYILFINA